MTPDPRLRSRWGAGSGAKKKRKNGSEKNGADGPSSPRTVLAEAMLTTAGIAALATTVQPPGGAEAGGASTSGSRGLAGSNGHQRRGPPARGCTTIQPTPTITSQNSSWTHRPKN